MVFGAGEILQGCAKRFRWQNADVHLHSAAQLYADLIFAFGQHFQNAGKVHNLINHLIALRFAGTALACYQQVQVANRLTAASQGAGRRYFFHARKFAEQGDHLLCNLVRRIQRNRPVNWR